MAEKELASKLIGGIIEDLEDLGSTIDVVINEYDKANCLGIDSIDELFVGAYESIREASSQIFSAHENLSNLYERLRLLERPRKTYRSKNVVKAEQFDGSRKMAEEYEMNFIKATVDEKIELGLLNGGTESEQEIRPGDYIIMTETGKFEVLKERDFDEQFEEVPNSER